MKPLRCPFCGFEVAVRRVKRKDAAGVFRDWYRIKCSDCYAGLPDAGNLDKLIQRWNMRRDLENKIKAFDRERIGLKQELKLVSARIWIEAAEHVEGIDECIRDNLVRDFQARINRI